MSIQIIDGFQVNTALPIDNRIVASGSAARNAIPYKYHGLRVFDISDSVPYVWNGSSWVSENASGIVGSGTLYYFPIFSSSNVITNSLLFEYNGLIRTADNGNGPNLVQIDPEYGTISAQGGFYGPGSNITQINGANINNGSIPVSGASSKIIQGSTGQVLLSGNSFTSWTNQSLLSVGTASSSTNSRITRDSTNNVTQYLTFISSGAWAGVGSGNEGIRSNHIDLTYVPGTKTLTVGTVSATRINQNGGALSSTAASKLTFVNLSSTVGLNTSNLEFNNVRNTTGTDWFTSGYRIQSKVDTEYLSYIQFNGTNNDAGISIGTGYQSTNSTSNANERLRISSSGLFTINGTMRHVSPTFSSPGNVPSFIIGTGNLARTTQITISSVAYDRVIYVYSTSNSNFYYSTSGFFEIEIYIINGGLSQQIYTIFHGNDSDIRPTGFGYNYILPAGCSSTISLYKGNNVTWNTGTTGPTIYAISLKFGI